MFPRAAEFATTLLNAFELKLLNLRGEVPLLTLRSLERTKSIGSGYIGVEPFESFWNAP